MRRAGHERTASCDTTSSTPPAGSSGIVVFGQRNSVNGATSTVDPPSVEAGPSPAGTPVKLSEHAAKSGADRRRQVIVIIRKRIESRLSRRVRDLNVRFQGNTVVLEGTCATYYTKQLAQHAALGVLDDETLENAIVVRVPR
jgi:hypothetical protein